MISKMPIQIVFLTLKARTHRLIFRGLAEESAVESADSIQESSNYSTDSVIVGRLPKSNTFNIFNPLESADGSIVVAQQEIGPVGMGLKSLRGTYTQISTIKMVTLTRVKYRVKGQIILDR